MISAVLDDELNIVARERKGPPKGAGGGGWRGRAVRARAWLLDRARRLLTRDPGWNFRIEAVKRA